MDSILPHAKLMLAPVIKWNNRFTDAHCPYCNEIHRHKGTERDDVHQLKPIRRARCKTPLLRDIGIRYQLEYPLKSYEVEKSNENPHCFINSDIRIPDSNRVTRQIPLAPSDCTRSNPYAYKIQGDFENEVTAPNGIDQLIDGVANLNISSGPNRPFTEKPDTPRGSEPPVIHIREIFGLLNDAGQVRGRVGEISICIEWEQNSDTDVTTLQISVLSWEPGDIKIYYIFFETLEPGNMYLGHKIDKDIIYKRLREVRFCLLRRPFVSLKNLIARITPALKAVPVFRNNTYIVCLERLLYRKQPFPPALPPHMTVTSRDTPHWNIYNDHLGHTYADLVHMCQSPTIINRWNLADEFKTIAGLWRDGDFPAVYAISGYGTRWFNDGLTLLDGAVYTSLMIEIFGHMGYRFPEDRYDQGVPGRYHGSHAEMQVLAYLVERHRTVVGLRAKWGELNAIAPSGHLVRAVIGVSKRPCDVCHYVLQMVCKMHNFWITVRAGFVENSIILYSNYPHPE